MENLPKKNVSHRLHSLESSPLEQLPSRIFQRHPWIHLKLSELAMLGWWNHIVIPWNSCSLFSLGICFFLCSFWDVSCLNKVGLYQLYINGVLTPVSGLINEEVHSFYLLQHRKTKMRIEHLKIYFLLESRWFSNVILIFRCVTWKLKPSPVWKG